jgi:hypothetical protein
MSASKAQLAREARQAKDALAISTGAGPRPKGSPGAATAWDRKHAAHGKAATELEVIRRMQAEAAERKESAA